ncbi:DUF2971 domain-containing protein [Terracoccus luteus]|uniref:DUF2971 family protein n=1 Tax=Terracoccus luteus TaxID=53356 RepID=A0A839Q392_9MICO|nr:DUF2971 domain-containing protein [Terracoccus luteus]MBB2987602.1 hypothetical protein [Terracoccus luteus]MCP2173253.1 hypothetical protein [Terracoccus luteus]
MEVVPIDPDVPEVVYHYTSLAGLAGMLQTHELWASHPMFLNDRTEMTYASELVIDKLRARAEEILRLPANSSDVHEDRPEERAAVVTAAAESVENLRKDVPPRIYVASFSTEGDVGAMWQTYGAAGCSVGFRTEALERDPDRLGLAMRRVSYGEEEWTRRGRVDELLAPFPLDAVSELSLSMYSGIYAGRWALQTLLTVKDPSFGHEQECRLIVPEPQMREASRFEEGVRAGRGRLQPYVRVLFDPSAIEKVVIGPEIGEDGELSIQAALRLFNYFDVTVEPSQSSYRP